MQLNILKFDKKIKPFQGLQRFFVYSTVKLPCTGVAFIVQAIAQQYTSAAHVGIIFALEPVFAGIVAFIFAHEVLLPRAYFGALLMIAGLFIMEIDFTKLRIRKQIVK